MTQTGDTTITNVIEFQPWGKTPRLFRDITITEKIDGTNAAVIIVPLPDELLDTGDNGFDLRDYEAVECISTGEDVFLVGAQSRKRLIFPGKATDNYGFAGWVQRNAQALVELLGTGTHYGEWWGQGIQGNPYGVDGKRFDLFNTHRYADLVGNRVLPEMGVVPTIYTGPYSEDAIRNALDTLAKTSMLPGTKVGAYAEGVIVYHSASRQGYKALLENDHISKTEAAAA